MILRLGRFWELEAAVRDFDFLTGHRLPAEWRDEVGHGLLDEIVVEHLMSLEARRGSWTSQRLTCARA